jgi:hypothetical protein
MELWAWTEMWRSRCVLAWVLGAFFFDLFLAGAIHLFTCERQPREDAIWPLTRAACRTGWRWECSLSAHKDRSSVDLVSLDYFRTDRPPCIGRGCGVRLIVDSTLPVGGSVWSWWEMAFLLRRLRPDKAWEWFDSFEGPLAGSTSSTAGVAPH